MKWCQFYTKKHIEGLEVAEEAGAHNTNLQFLIRNFMQSTCMQTCENSRNF